MKQIDKIKVVFATSIVCLAISVAFPCNPTWNLAKIIVDIIGLLFFVGSLSILFAYYLRINWQLTSVIAVAFSMFATINAVIYANFGYEFFILASLVCSTMSIIFILASIIKYKVAKILKKKKESH